MSVDSDDQSMISEEDEDTTEDIQTGLDTTATYNVRRRIATQKGPNSK